MKAVIFVLLFAGCSLFRPQTKFRKLLSQHKCEEASINLPHFSAKKSDSNYFLIQKTHGINLVYYVTDGLILPTILCEDDDLNSLNCFHAGAMEELCPNLGASVDQILEVTDCFAKNNQAEKALEQLIVLSDPKALGGCINRTHQKTIEERIRRLKI